MPYRTESDTLGPVQVPLEAYFGAQTVRSKQYFSIGQEKMPLEVIHALALLKKSAAKVNAKLGILPLEKESLICAACEEVLAGKWDKEFPLFVWQTGSGTQTNMNVNEVIANRAIELARGVKGSKTPIHPNDHVNLSQSSNDTFPSAMHISAALLLEKKLFPSLQKLQKALQEKEHQFATIVKIGRTHLQDATPLTLGQEFSGYSSLLKRGKALLRHAQEGLFLLAIGGTAVGTGLNTPPGFREEITQELSRLTHLPFRPHPNPFAALSAHEEIVSMSSALKNLALSLFKIASDIRLLGSGPRCGLQELLLPENEPGSSIMPGKVNPTQCEALTMIATQVLGNDTTISFAASQGHFELNVFKPVILYNLLQSIHLLSDGMSHFSAYCIEGLVANKKQIASYVENSLMLATALTPKIGYDNSAKVVHLAHDKGISLKKACLELQLLTSEEFDQIVDPIRMAHPHK